MPTRYQIVTDNQTQTLTNKTLTSPVFQGTVDGWISANETWTYASADAPTFTFTVAADVTTKYSAGMRIKLTQTTVKYFIITAVSTYSGGNTTITVYGGTDYILANAAITSPFYAVVKAPFGFPLDPTKWTVQLKSTSNVTQASPSASTWYNIGSLSITIPIGVWDVTYQVYGGAIKNTTTQIAFLVTLSTANNSESDADFTSAIFFQVGSANCEFDTTLFRAKTLALAAKTAYYLNAEVTAASYTSINFWGGSGNSPTIINAICAYL